MHDLSIWTCLCAKYCVTDSTTERNRVQYSFCLSSTFSLCSSGDVSTKAVNQRYCNSRTTNLHVSLYASSTSSVSTFRIMPSDVLPIRINLEIWILQRAARVLERVISRVARPLPTQNNTNIERHPCFEWDPNPRSQCLSGRRHFTP
jgi:hypothetical protein